MYNNQTLNAIFNIFQAFAEAHGDVFSFFVNAEDQMSEITSKNEAFPEMYIHPVNAQYGLETDNHTLRIYVFDRLTKDKENTQDKWSRCNQILKELDIWLKEYVDNQIEVDIDRITNATPIVGDLMTDVAGYYADFVITNPGITICDIPFISDFVITGATCSNIYPQPKFLTCDTLTECDTFTDVIDNLQEQIDNIEGENFYTTGATLSGTTVIFDRNDQTNAYSVDLSPIIPIPFDCDNLSGCTIIQDIENDINDRVPYTGATQNVNLGEFGLDTGYIKLDTTPTNTPTTKGTLSWDTDDNTIKAVLNGYIMKIGEDQFYPVKNQSGSNIPKGTAVRFAGTLGSSGRLLIEPFIGDGSIPSSFFMGVTAENIADGADGKVLWFGRIRSIDTSMYIDGDVLYASTTTAGGYQTTTPQAPNNIVQIAAVINSHPNQGVIFVRPTLGGNINNDEGVLINTPTDKQVLQYDAVSGLWKNQTLPQIGNFDGGNANSITISIGVDGGNAIN
jgi:hypothetical protein